MTDEKYMNLVKRLPLLPIVNQEAHESAKAMIVELTSTDNELAPSEVGYAKVLVQLIQNYESVLVKEFFENVNGNDALNFLLEKHSMKQIEAAEIAGVSKQNMNDFLRGRGRGLPKAARAKLAKYFKVTPQVFELVDALALT